MSKHLRLYIFVLYLVGGVALPVFGQAESGGTEGLVIDIADRPPGTPDFEDHSPADGSTVTETQPTISVNIFVEAEGALDEDSFGMTVTGCIPPHGPHYQQDDPGVTITEITPQDFIFSIDLAGSGCTLSAGMIWATVEADATKFLFDPRHGVDAWSFIVSPIGSPPPPPGFPFLPSGPQIDRLNPDRGVSGDTVRVFGQTFTVPELLNRFQGAKVYFDGEPVSTMVENNTELTFTVPDFVRCGTHTVRVRNEGLFTRVGGASESNPMGFVVNCLIARPQAPFIEQFEPPQGAPGDEINLTGGNFVAGSPLNRFQGARVLFDGTSIPTTFIDSQHLSFIVPAFAVCGEAVLQVDNGPLALTGRSSEATFTVTVCDDLIRFSNVQPSSYTDLTEPMSATPVVSLEITTVAPGANIQLGSIELSLDQCPGLVFKTISGGQFTENAFSVDLANLIGTPCVLPGGANTAFVTASDSAGNFSQASWTFQVQPVIITLDPPAPVADQRIDFIALTHEDLNANDGDFRWFLDLGDGFIGPLENNSGQALTENTIWWGNPDPGQYLIRVEVRGSGGIVLAVAERPFEVTGGPSGSPSPGPGETSIPEALDTNGNHEVDAGELQQAIEYWVMDQPVPGTGQTVNDCMVKLLTKLWIMGGPITDQSAVQCGGLNATAAAQPASVPLQMRAVQLTAPDPHHRDIRVLGGGGHALHVQVFDLGGRLLVEAQNTGPALRVALQTVDGQRLANGVYLYVVTVDQVDGPPWRSPVGKLTVLR